MARLSIVAAFVTLVVAAPARADPVDAWEPYIAEASARFGIPAEWIARVMRAESGGRTTLDDRPIVSRAGAMGLMQLMPGTWADMRAALGLGADAQDPHDNIMAGSYYLRLMYDRFGYPGLFAAYNAGPARYAAWVEGLHTLPGETQAYLASVAGADDNGPARETVAPVNGMFFALGRARSDSAEGLPPASGMFVALDGRNGE